MVPSGTLVSIIEEEEEDHVKLLCQAHSLIRYIVIFGVPQDSVTGPLCFVNYTHVVGRILRRHKVRYHIYADDIQVYLTPDPSIPGDVQCALFKLSRCVVDIQHWMIENKLKLNQDKTEFFVAASHHNLKKLGNISLFLDDTEVFPSKSIRKLGVVFGSQMCYV